MDDTSLAEATGRGDEEAYRVLIERYRRFIYAIAYRIVLDEQEALDVCQEVFLRVWQKIGSLRSQGEFRPWLAVLVSRQAIDHLRRTSRRKEVRVEPASLIQITNSRHASPEPSPAEALDEVRRREKVEKAIATLSPQQRAILTLQISEDMGPKEISECLGLSSRQVRSQLHRAITRVRRFLKEGEDRGSCLGKARTQ